jgi:hypothetical protein
VFWALTGPYRVFLKEPVLAWFADWAAWRGSYGGDLVVRKDGVTEGLLAIALLLDLSSFDCHGHYEAIAFFTDDRSVDVALGPYCP